MASSRCAQPRDMLTNLPNELLHNILSYLVAPYACLPGTTGLRYTEIDTTTWTKKQAKMIDLAERHPFLQLAAVNHNLKDVVENFCWHLLKRHQGVGPWKNKLGDREPLVGKIQWVKGKRRQAKKTTFRMIWIRWAKRHCAFCGNRSNRRAIFNNLIRCCQQCDRKEWPEKITKTECLKPPYHLTLYDLFPPNPIISHTFGLPPLKYATYDCMGVETTMFLLPEIKELSAAVHGDGLSPEEYLKQPPELQVTRKVTVAEKTREGRKLRLKFVSGQWHEGKIHELSPEERRSV